LTDVAFNLSLVGDAGIVIGLKSRIIKIKNFGGGEMMTLIDVTEGFPLVRYLDLKINSVPSLLSLLKLIFPDFPSLAICPLELQEVSIFWSTKGGLPLPTGTMSLPLGFSFEGEVTLHGLEMFMFLNAETPTRVQGIFQCMKIEIKSPSSSESILSIYRPKHDEAKDRGKGRFHFGPVFSYSSGSRSNSMEASLAVDFLRKHFSVFGSIVHQGLKFPLPLSDLIQGFNLNFELNQEGGNFRSFHANGTFTFAPEFNLTFKDRTFQIQCPSFIVGVTAELGLHGVSFDLKWNFNLYHIHLQNNFTVNVTTCWELRNIPHRIIQQIKKDFFDCGPQWFETLHRIFFPELIQMMVLTPPLHHIPHQWAEQCEKIQNIPKEVHSAVDSFVEMIKIIPFPKF
jgi:hypothetical protein